MNRSHLRSRLTPRSLGLGFPVSNFRTPFVCLTLTFTFLLTSYAQDQTINGNLTVTGSIEATGSVDSGANTLTFGTQGSSFGGALLHQDSNADTFTFFSNRNPASWLWQHTVGIAAMRLDSAHQLIIYQADGTTAGVTLRPATNSIRLGAHANGTLTADANGGITAGGAFVVAGGITNTNGTLSGGSSGLALNAGGTNQNITFTPTGTGRTIINNASFPGNVLMGQGKWIGSNEGEHSVGFGTGGGRLALTGDWVHSLFIGDSGLEYYNGTVGLTKWYVTTAGAMALYAPIITPSGQELIKWSWVSTAVNELTIANAVAGSAPALRASGDDTNIDLALSAKGSGKVVVNGSALTVTGNVGVGTTTPGAKLHLQAVAAGAEIAGLYVQNGSPTENASIRNVLALTDNYQANTNGRFDTLAKRQSDGSVDIAYLLSPGSSGTPVTRAYFDGSTGNVGIGTTAPAVRLHVQNGSTVPVAPWYENAGVFYATDTISNQEIVSGVASSSPSTRPVVLGRRSRGSLSAPGSVASGDQVFSLIASGYDGTNFLNAAAISFEVDGAASNGSVPMRIGLATGTNLNDRSERLSVKANGDIGIGTLLPRGKLDVSTGTDESGSKVLVGGQELALIDRYNGTDYSAKIWASWPGHGLMHFGLNANAGSPETVVPTITIMNASGAGSVGNVGIGTTAPSEKLEVVGNLKVSGTFSAANYTATGGAFSGGSSGLTFNAGGTNQNVTLAPSGTGHVVVAPGRSLRVGAYGSGTNDGILFSRSDSGSMGWMGAIGSTNSLSFGTGAAVGSNPSMSLNLSTGNVGIGTQNPVSSLHLAGGGDTQLTITADADNNGENDNPLLLLQQDGNLVNGLFGITGDAGGLFSGALVNATFLEAKDTASQSGLQLVTGGSTIGGVNGTARLTILHNGNVGVGTTNPASKLEVGGTGARIVVRDAGEAISSSFPERLSLYARSTGPDAETNEYGPKMSFRTLWGGTENEVAYIAGFNDYAWKAGLTFGVKPQGNGQLPVPAMTIRESGNIGIGTTAPTEKLEVIGNLKVTGTFTAANYSASGGIVTGGTTGLALNAGGSNQNVTLTPTGTGSTVLNGKVGIGTTSPSAHLQIASPQYASGAGPVFRMSNAHSSDALTLDAYTNNTPGSYAGEGVGGSVRILMSPVGGYYGMIGTTNSSRFHIITNATPRVTVIDTGNVGIGTTNPTHKLAVNGTIRAKEVIVDTGWADYVFEDDYRLAPLAEVEQHIREKKHLPGIPSAAEVAEHGVSMGDMQSKLLSKVEELTLHLIRMEKENAELRQRVETLETAATNP